MSDLSVPFVCDWCGQSVEGIPFGGVREHVCAECWCAQGRLRDEGGHEIPEVEGREEGR